MYDSLTSVLDLFQIYGNIPIQQNIVDKLVGDGKWNMDDGVWNMGDRIWMIEYGIWMMEYGIWNMDDEYGVWMIGTKFVYDSVFCSPK